MIISFFEEFPNKKNLTKLNFITFPTKLYLAATSYKEFQKIKQSIKNKHVKELIYWPILEIKEGYWISPFSQRTALKRILNEIPTNQPVMLDLELPTTKNPLLYLTQLFNFSCNKKLIRQFISQHRTVYAAEYYPKKQKFLQFLGLHFPHTKVIKMMYHSMHHFNEEFVKKELQNLQFVAYGTIATGIGGNEPLLTTSQLKKDLQLAQEAKLKEVIIFRLGGLNQKYPNILKQFQ